MYTQNDEELYILKKFKTFKGTCLDIGAFDGIKLSNTRALVEAGWKAVLVEPDPVIFEQLKKNNEGNKSVFLKQGAIGEKNGIVNFWSNPTYYGTVKMEQVELWKTAGEQFKPIEVKMQNFKTFLNDCEIKTFDFISIDAEGLDLEILKQIDLNKVMCQMICVEHNSKILNEVREYIESFGFRTVVVNAENVIMEKYEHI